MEAYVAEGYQDKLRKELLDVVEDFREVIPTDLRSLAAVKSGEFLRTFRAVSGGVGDAKELEKACFDMLNIGHMVREAVKEANTAQSPSAPSPPTNIPLPSPVGPPPTSPGRITQQPVQPVETQDVPTVVRATRISKRFASTHFDLAELSFDLRLGEITALVGRNGSGKSTLLRIVLGELASDTGSLEYPMLEGRGRRPIKENIGHVAQRSAHWYGRVRENLEFYAAAYGIRGKANIERVDWVLNRFGLIEYEEHTWAQLSGGYQLRFELARAMLHRPDLLILDEPLANLDVVSQQEFLDDLKLIANSRGSQAAILVTSQHLFEMEAIADQLIVLQEGQQTFLGDIGLLAERRQFNSFELSTEVPEPDLRIALSNLKVKAIRRFTTHYQLDFPLEIEQSRIMRVLSSLPVATSYIRDISCSTRPLMTGAEGTAPIP